MKKILNLSFLFILVLLAFISFTDEDVVVNEQIKDNFYISESKAKAFAKNIHFTKEKIKK